MSSTNRGYARHISDHYITPEEPIRLFMNKFMEIEKESSPIVFGKSTFIFDPCAGGLNEPNEVYKNTYDMPYPKVLKELGFDEIGTNDIRLDSPAEVHVDYLDPELEFNYPFEMVISNPPFNLALEIITRALKDVIDGGYVIMLLRLNFFGSQARKPFWDKNMPKYCFIHSSRMSFFPENVIYVNDKGKTIFHEKNSTDSCEYAHIVWQVGHKPNFTQMFIL